MKKVISAIIMVAMAIGICSCSKGTEATTEITGETIAAEITADWELVQFTTKGEVALYSDFSDEEKDIAPKFHTDDGDSFVFSINGKDHPGTISVDGDKYILSYGDSEKVMEAKIDGNKLHISIEGSDTSFDFVAK